MTDEHLAVKVKVQIDGWGDWNEKEGERRAKVRLTITSVNRIKKRDQAIRTNVLYNHPFPAIKWLSSAKDLT